MNTLSREEYLTLTHNQHYIIFMPNIKHQRQVTIPKKLRMYLLIINWTGGRLKKLVKRWTLRPLCTLCELIANW